MDETPEPPEEGVATRPPRRGYKEGNVGPDGNYLVGKNRTPVSTRFAFGDNRKRGRRAKGQRNFDTDFLGEAGKLVTLTEGGKKRKVTKAQAVMIRLLHNAGVAGQNAAIAMALAHLQRIGEKVAPSAGLSANEDAMVNEWLQQRLAQQMLGDEPGDPEGPVEDDINEDPTSDEETGDD